MRAEKHPWSRIIISRLLFYDRSSVIRYLLNKKKKDKNPLELHNRDVCIIPTCLEKDRLLINRRLKIFELLPWFFYLVKDAARSRTTTWHNNPFSLKVFRNKTCAFTNPCHREVSNSHCSHQRFTITESKFPYFRNFATFSKKVYIIRFIRRGSLKKKYDRGTRLR